MTPRRWRRRILTISSLDVAGSAVPRDLSIRLPQVQRRDIEQPIVLLPQEPRGGELHQGGRVRVCEDRGRDLETTATLLGEHIAIQDGTVADREHIAGQGLQGRGDRFLAGATEDLDPPEDLLLGADRDGDLRGRRLDGDDDHGSALHGPVTATSSSARSTHEGPSAVIAMRRASEPPAGSSEVSSTRSRSSGRSSSTASPHSTISTQAPSSTSSRARSTTSWTRSNRKTSTWAMGMRPVTYSRISVKVGDATCSLAPSPLAIPRTSVVFPAPSSPVRTITSWMRSSGAMAAPTARVSSAVPVRSWSST